MSTVAAAPPRTRWVLAAVLTATFMTQTGVTAINVAVPDLRADLGAGAAASQWVLAGYVLPFALLLIPGGRLGDLFGSRRLFLAGVAGFTLASALAAAAPGVAVLITARVLQGVFAAMMGPQVLVVLRSVVPEARRGAVLGAYSAVIGLGTVGGPVLGGILVQSAPFDLGWRAVPAMNVLLGQVVCVLGLTLPGTGRDGGGGRDRDGLDAPGVLMAGAALLLLLYPLLNGAQSGWPWYAWAMLAAAPPALVLFAVVEYRMERRGGSPLIPVLLFTNRTFAAGLAVTVVTAGLVSGFFLAFVIYLQEGVGLTPAMVGLLVSPWALGTALVSAPAIRLARTRGRTVLVAGSSVMAAGMAVLGLLVSQPEPGPPLPWTMAALLVVGAGMGLVNAPILEMVLGVLPDGDAGAVAGLFTTFKQIGAALGVTLIGGLFFMVLGGPGGGPAAHVGAMVATTVCGVAVCLLAVVLLFLMPSHGARK